MHLIGDWNVDLSFIIILQYPEKLCHDKNLLLKFSSKFDPIKTL